MISERDTGDEDAPAVAVSRSAAELATLRKIAVQLFVLAQGDRATGRRMLGLVARISKALVEPAS